MMINRWLPLSGIAFVVIVLVAVVGLGGSTPDTDASGAEIRSFYDDESVQQAVTAFVLAASVPFLVLFAVALAGAFAPAGEPTTRIWPSMLVGGSILAGALLLVGAVIHFALADAADQRVSEAAMQALNMLDADGWVGFNAAFGVMMLGAAGSLLSTTGAFRWLGWVALVLGIALFIPFADFIALLAMLLWIVVASVVLFRGRLGATHAAAPSPA